MGSCSFFRLTFAIAGVFLLRPSIANSRATVTGSCPTCYAPITNDGKQNLPNSTGVKEESISLEDIDRQSADRHVLTYHPVTEPLTPMRVQPFARESSGISQPRMASAHPGGSVAILRDCHGAWQWQADGKPILMRQGVSYQPTEGDLHI